MNTRSTVPPDGPLVSFDPTERAQTLTGKLAPQVFRGRVPRTVTGAINIDALPDFPSIVVQAIHAKVETLSTMVTVRMFFHVYDENQDSQGYQDVLNMMEKAAAALTSWGQGALNGAYPIVMPIEWKLHDEEGTFPHFVGEMTTVWELPSAAPLPDPATADYPDQFALGFIPAEQVTLAGEESPPVLPFNPETPP